MSGYSFNFQVDGDALHHLCKAFDQYVEKWPGGDPREQEALKSIQVHLHKAYLEFKLLNDE